MKASSTTAYDQLTQWDQQWQVMDMSVPLEPVNDTDASNGGIQKPDALEPGQGPAVEPSNAQKVGAQGLNVYA